MDQEVYCVVGHSFCRKLQEFCDRPGWENLGMLHSKVDFHHLHAGNPIALLSDLTLWVNANTQYLQTLTVLCIEIGTNDIVNQGPFYYNGQNLGHAVFALASRCHDLGVKKVVVMEIIYREGQAAIPRHLRPEYNPDVIRQAVDDFRIHAREYNWVMQGYCIDLPQNGVVFLKQDGVHRRWGRRLYDGLHFNYAAQKTHFHNIRNALMRQAGKARGDHV